MSRATSPRRRGQHDRTSGLSALVALINDELARRGTALAGPMFPMAAVAGGPLGPVGPSVRRSAVDTSPLPRRDGLLGRMTRTLQPATPGRDPRDPGGTGPDGDGSDRELASVEAGLTDVDDEHVETWRLVRRAQDGDGEAFGLLYDRYVDSVFRFIYYRVNDRALAEDFTSETFVRALRRISSISYQGRDIGAWFVTIARNIVLDHVKSARNRLESTTGDSIEPDEPAQSTESAVLENLEAERLHAAVAKLGDEQRECVTLRFMQGLSVSETAAVMGKNEGAIKALQHRAIRKLADLIGDDLR